MPAILILLGERDTHGLGGAFKFCPGVLPLIVHFARTHTWRLILLITLAALNAVAGFATFASVSTIVQHVASFPSVAQSALLLLLLIGTALLTQTISAKLGADFVAAMRRNVADRLIARAYQPAARHSVKGTSTFINDIAEIAPLSGLAPMFAYNVLLAAVVTSYLIYVSVPLALVVVFQTGALLSVSMILMRRIIPAFDQLRSVDDKLFQSINSIERGNKELVTNRQRAMHFREHVIFPAISAAEAVLKSTNQRTGYYHAWSSTLVFIIILVTALVSRILFPLPQAQFTSFMVACLLLIAPANFLVSSAQPITRGLAAVKRIDRFVRGDLQNNAESSELLGNWHTLSCTDARYCYLGGEQGRVEVGPLTLSIGRGEIVFVIGPNGSGKSTLLLMLSGLLDPASGEIELDSRNMRNVRDSYRERLSIIFSDFHVFDHLLDHEGSPAVSAAVTRWIDELGLSGVVDVSDGRLSRTDASTGQRKRLALLQMLLENREVIILDEIASDLDPEFKRYFYHRLLPWLRDNGGTIVLATHDTEYFSCADRLVRMENGRLVADAE